MVGILAYIFFPGFTARVEQYLQTVFRDIFSDPKVTLNFTSAVQIFLNNLRVTLLGMFLGVFFALIPLAVVALNFFIIGFFFSMFSFSSKFAGQALPGVVYYLLAILPHGIFELPAILIGASLGLRLGFFWMHPKPDQSRSKNLILILKKIAYFLPVITLLLALAAISEIFLTGKFVEALLLGLKP